MSNASWEHFYHEADIGVRGLGNNLAEAFEQAALALSAVISDLEQIQARDKIEISCQSADVEYLFVDWLNSLVYEMAIRKMLFGRFKVTIHGDQLTAQVWGEKVDVARHQPAVEIKGATLTELGVRQLDNGQWLAQCVVDV